MTIEEALASIVDDGINLGAADFGDVEALKVAADVLRKAIEGNPVIPGHDDQYNIAEMSYNNGSAKGLEDGKPKWIPASEPPKVWRDENCDAINFLIFTPNIGIDIGNWIEPMKMWFCLGVPFKVTHWMPLPEPPKEDTVKP